jgi:hypothetical protein
MTFVGGQTSARRNPTGTILGNQAIKQEAKRACKTKAIIERKQATDKTIIKCKK